MSKGSSSGRLATGLQSPISWLVYAGLAIFVGIWLAPYWREATMAFASTALAGLVWLSRSRHHETIATREQVLARLDAMRGDDFEQWITRRLVAAGYLAHDVRHSGDFGVDVLAEIDGLRVGIQAKRYADAVGNEAVQEVLAGCDYHRCEVAAVVTQSRFTEAARQQAARGRYPVVLVDRRGVLELARTLAAELGRGELRRRVVQQRARDLRAMDRIAS